MQSVCKIETCPLGYFSLWFCIHIYRGRTLILDHLRKLYHCSLHNIRFINVAMLIGRPIQAGSKFINKLMKIGLYFRILSIEIWAQEVCKLDRGTKIGPLVIICYVRLCNILFPILTFAHHLCDHYRKFQRCRKIYFKGKMLLFVIYAFSQRKRSNLWTYRLTFKWSRAYTSWGPT